MNWITIASIATAISAVVGCASLWSAFYLYQSGKKHERARKVRDALVASRTLAQQLDGLLTYEMGYEITQCVISSSTIQLFLREVHAMFFADGQNKTEDELEAYLKAHTPIIFSPIHSPNVDAFEKKIADLQQEQAVIAFDNPGVGRIASATLHVLRNTFRGQKRLVHDESAWTTALRQIFTNKKPSDSDFDTFKDRLVLMFVGTWLQVMEEVNQPNINDTIATLELVADRYLRKTAQQLITASHHEKKIDMIPDNKTKTIADDLREGEKCLAKILPTEDLLLLRQYSAQLEARSQKRKGKDD